MRRLSLLFMKKQRPCHPPKSTNLKGVQCVSSVSMELASRNWSRKRSLFSLTFCFLLLQRFVDLIQNKSQIWCRYNKKRSRKRYSSVLSKVSTIWSQLLNKRATNISQTCFDLELKLILRLEMWRGNQSSLNIRTQCWRLKSAAYLRREEWVTWRKKKQDELKGNTCISWS